MSAPARVLVVDADPALAELLQEWLGAEGWSVEHGPSAADGYGLIVVDVPFPRQARDALRGLVRAHPGTPVLVLSSSFLPGVDCGGGVARALGVAGVLAKPVSETALLAAVRTLLT
jgi:DNA-binding response OmpR family regulator